MAEHTIDATNRSIGRVASQAAVFLMGKNTPTFKNNAVANVKVYITNASKVNISTKKLATKKYKNYSGYPGGLKEVSLGRVIDKKGYGEVFKKAISGMLPSNKLKKGRMKNLKVSD